MVALVSVVATALPIIRDVARPSRSDIRLMRFYYTQNGLSLVVNNKGRMPGFISSCKMEIVELNGKPIWPFNFNLDKPSETRVIKGDSRLSCNSSAKAKWVMLDLSTSVSRGKERKGEDDPKTG